MAIKTSIEAVVKAAKAEGVSYGMWVANHEPPTHNGYKNVGRKAEGEEKYE